MEQSSGAQHQNSNSDLVQDKLRTSTANINVRSSEIGQHQDLRLQNSSTTVSHQRQGSEFREEISQRRSNTFEQQSPQEAHDSRQNLFSVGKGTAINTSTSEIVSKYTDLLGTKIQNPVTHIGTGSYNTSFGAALSKPVIRQTGFLGSASAVTRDQYTLAGSSSAKVFTSGPIPIPISTGAPMHRISNHEEFSSIQRNTQLPRVGSDTALPFPTRMDMRSKLVSSTIRQHEENGDASRQTGVHHITSGVSSPPPEQLGVPMYRVSNQAGGTTNTTSSVQGGTRTTTHTTVYPGRVTMNETLVEHPAVVKSYVERPSMIYAPSVPTIPAPRVLVTGQPFVTGGYATVTERVVSSGNLRESHVAHSTAIKTTTTNTASSAISQSESLSTIQRQKEHIEELQAKLAKAEAHESSLTGSLRRTVDTLQGRQTDLEEKLKKVSLERDELLFKLEGREDVQGSLKEKVLELESDLRMTKAKSQRIEGDLASLTAERTELEATIRKLQSEQSSRQLSSDMNSNEALNRLKISEERCRHLEKRNLDLEDELLRVAREFKEFRERAGANDRSTIARPVLTGLDGVDQQTHNALLAQLKEKSLLADEYKMKFESAEQRANRAEKALAELQRTLDAERANFVLQLQSKESEKKTLKSKLEELQSKYDELNSKLFAQTSQVENSLRQIEALKAKLKSAEEENDQLKKDRAALAADKKQLEMKCQNFELENQRMQRALDSKTQELQRVEADLIVKQEKISQLTKSLGDANQTISDLQNKIKQLESAIARLERELEGKASPEEISAPLQAEIARLQELLQALREELRQKTEDYEMRIEEYDSTLLKAEERINALSKQVEELEAAKLKAEDDLISLQEVSEKFICDNHTLQTERDALREEVLMLQEQLEHQGGLMLDGELVMHINERIQKLLDIIRAKDEEIQGLYRFADSATKVANDRLAEIETVHQQKAQLLNNVANSFEELSKVGIRHNLEPLGQESAR